MTLEEVEALAAGLPGVRRVENEEYGYTFFFAGDEQMLPFVSIATADNEGDDVSNLAREGVFRVNIGLGRETYEGLGLPDAAGVDYSALNVLLPHPHYARQHYVCILKPEGDNAETTRRLILEAHARADARQRRKGQGRAAPSAP